jgi:hypothetical protein
VRYELGLYDPDTYDTPSYRSIEAQVTRLEEALQDEWVSADGTKCNVSWPASNLIRSSVPARRLQAISAVAIDGTAWEARARLKARKRTKSEIESEPAVAYEKSLDESDGSIPAPEVPKIPTRS